VLRPQQNTVNHLERDLDAGYTSLPQLAAALNVSMAVCCLVPRSKRGQLVSATLESITAAAEQRRFGDVSGQNVSI
jgi:hypothetical protein